MPDVFVNYRTGDGEETAVAIERELSHRFPGGRIFRAGKSLTPGRPFGPDLITNVRRSGALIAVIGPRWTEYTQLHDAGDWVRKEIEEAFRCAVPVIPVLVGRTTERLREEGLPPSLAPLAACHSIRFDTHDAEYGLRRIGDAVADLVPGLASYARQAGPDADPGTSPYNSMANVSGGTNIQARDIGGDAGGTIIKDVHASLHLGSGAQHNHAPHLSGDGAQYVAGDNNGGVHHSWNRERRKEDGSR
ncbi:toll/interleukin-1 receptor domain-containing protein [Streptomyces sp. NPDC093546]|uniref:toll/interleukin-1 receptor domain-containing protein n=1 Tax=Streptomyces sp. NPDC093546 TaxID=3366040 RepID=UPI0038060DD8